MRGGFSPRVPRRTPKQPISQAIARTESIPAPIGGWNTRDAVAAMHPLDAVTMDNFYPKPDTVALRSGKSSHATGLTGGVYSLIPYAGGAAQKLFASTPTGIYDVTASGAVGAAAIVVTDGKFENINVTNAGGSFTLAVNGVDTLKLYDGTVWASITGGSTPAITGITTSDISNITLFKKRVWFVKKNTMSAWYLATDAISGAATEFPMGTVFKRGGYLVAQSGWTVDGGDGVDDYFVTATSEGELAIYRGTDPAASATFALVGTFFIGEPLGKKCFLPFGSDIVYLSKEGITPLTKLLVNALTRPTNKLSYKIEPTFNEYAKLYGGNFGWCPIYYPTEAAIIVNVPVVSANTSYQLVCNSITKSWCRFTGWNATCFVNFNEALYSGEGSVVFKNWTGLKDDSAAIVGTVQQAYTNLKYLGQKQLELVRPNFSGSGQATVSVGLLTDFQNTYSTSTNTVGVSNSNEALWDTAIWDTSVWPADATHNDRPWIAIPNNPGYFHSFRLQITTSTATIAWASNDYAYQPIGIL